MFGRTGSLSDGGLVQSVKQTDRVRQTSVLTIGVGRKARIVRSSTLTEAYPISFSYPAASDVDDNNYSLDGTVDMGQQVSAVDLGEAHPVRRGWNWTVDSYGVQARVNGATSAKDGHSSTSYVGTDHLGRQHHKTIVTNHVLVMKTIGR